MRFLLDDEQREFARSLDALLTAAGTPAVVRTWSTGDHGPGRALWARLAEAGVFALAVPEEHAGLGPRPVELTVAFAELGRYAVPGPLVETVAVAALLDRLDDTTDWLPGIASGKTVASLCLLTPGTPYALDADAADLVLVVTEDTVRVAESAGPVQPSADPARRLARPLGGTPLAQGPQVRAAAAHAADVAALATAAQALGVGRALLDRTVDYVKQRTQFGRPIGSFQALKHHLADTLIALEFAQPLVHAAAVALTAGADRPSCARDIAAAKLAASEATYQAARVALQCHGALGYTEELDLSLWLRKARALRTAWGTPAACRARVLAA
ncbi:acyl-CoA dehydrogenase family protein [Streptomyces lomondensis]|uniref:Acyl-CoA dehydrogenase FadE n=1 Tax=Streptomyces lomondensis TaxID=68229 RepID=A0ABQ2XIT0_9ACTN|nr:acyl-CoA dehydrogenase family protein [Streptomyces lomondensis]MCF0079593.1 acyl-CoA/acyl-ACP dehydrogenase [Streptomyces lomondensis]GGX19118.1 putative acyl-CoA dehydrogenase FadE [Streptomyces lomondensis]